MRVLRRTSAVPFFCRSFRNNNLRFTQAIARPILTQCDQSIPFTSSTLNPLYNVMYEIRPTFLGFSQFCTSTDQNGDDPDDHFDDREEEDGESRENDEKIAVRDPVILRDVEKIVGVLRDRGRSRAEAKAELEQQCDVKITTELVDEVLSRLRNDWEAAYMFFLWAEKQPGYTHSVREYHSMIAILAKMRKFDTAWAIIDEMRGIRTGMNLVTPQTLLIMIRRYCAVHDVGKAINTFYAHKRFKFDIGLEEFQDLLSALCRYKNVKDAEHLLFANKDVYPMNTKSFNIVLNGWCNVVGDLREGKRIWGEMKERGIRRDVFSYASLMSCLSKAGNIYAVFKLSDEMKHLGIEPDRKAYNAVIHALAKGKLVNEARNLMKMMEEKGVLPDTVTYNSLIMPLCKRRQLGEAKEVFDEMINRGMCPTVRTYHGFFRSLRTGEEVFELLQKMYTIGCHPSHDSYTMLIRKFCRWRQIDNVFKLWSEMSKNGLEPDRSSYIVLIHGLFLNGELEEANKYYIEMKEKHLLPEPKIEEMIKAWLASKQETGRQTIDSKHNPAVSGQHGNSFRLKSDKVDRKINFLRQPESRRLTRERGFSFVDE